MRIFSKNDKKIANFLFVEQEIINTLSVVFDGYETGEYRFIPPELTLCLNYQFFFESYSDLYLDTEVEKFRSKHSLFTDLNSFNSLDREYDIKIESWNILKESIISELNIINNLLPKETNVDEKLLTLTLESRILLDEHLKLKNSFFNKLIIKSIHKNPKLPEDFYVNIDKHQYHAGNNIIKFQSKKSNRLKIMRLLHEGNGEFVDVNYIAKKIKKDCNFVFVSICEIKKMIIKNNPDAKLQIDSSGTSQYKITPIK